MMGNCQHGQSTSGSRDREDSRMEPVSKPRRRNTRVATWVAAFALLVFGATYTAISLFTADRLTRPTNHPSQFDPREWIPNAQPWSTRTADRITLRGWYL